MVTAMISGRETLDSIEQALKEVSETVDRLNGELDQTNQDKAKLIAQRLEAFQGLARFRTELALVDGVIDEADQLSGQVRTILQVRQKTLESLKERQARAENERAQLLDRQKSADAEIERLEEELDAHGKRARQILASDPAYSGHAKRHEELEGMVAKASEKAEKSRAEDAKKGAPYRDDPLFMYLWERKYGASDYDKTGIIRALDEWVARLIGYQDARANFAILTQIPERLAAHVERLRQAAQTEREALDVIEAAKIKELAGADLPEKLRAAHLQRSKETAALEHLNAELLETGNQLKLYAEGLDQSFQDAVEKTAAFLNSQTLSALLTEARRTPDVSDDEFVALIGKLADELAALERIAKTKREALDAAFARKQELLRIASEFRRSRYDRPGSVFEPGAGGEVLLKLLLEGAINAAEYWARTRRGQRWRGRPADSYRRSENFPMGGGARGGSSGPDFRTGGGF